MLRNSVLFVDDEVNILHALRRLFVDYHLNIVTAESAFKAMDILKYTDISVIVCDNFMPGMKGIDFLEKAKLISPDSVKIMMTAHADLSVAMDAINKGEVYKVVTKPWDDEELKNTMLDALDRFNIIHSMRNASEGALLSLAQTIELKDPYTRGHCERVAQYAVAVAIALGFKEEQKRDLRCGSYLHDCGKIGVPEAILNKPGQLTDEEMDVVRKHPAWGAEVVRLANLPERVVNIILYHHERYDGRGYPTGLRGKEIPIEARVVSVADVYDALTSDRPYRQMMPTERAIQSITDSKGHQFDPRAADILIRTLLEGSHGPSNS